MLAATLRPRLAWRDSRLPRACKALSIIRSLDGQPRPYLPLQSLPCPNLSVSAAIATWPQSAVCCLCPSHVAAPPLEAVLRASYLRYAPEKPVL